MCPPIGVVEGGRNANVWSSDAVSKLAREVVVEGMEPMGAHLH